MMSPTTGGLICAISSPPHSLVTPTASRSVCSCPARTRKIKTSPTYSPTWGSDEGPDNKASNIGVYLEEQFDATDTLTLVFGGRGQYAYRSVSDHFLQNNDQSGNVDFFAVSPKLGGIWHVTPGVQVYGNISHAYEPPLILELTAPGQIGGNLQSCRPKNRGNLKWHTRQARAHGWSGTWPSTTSSCGMRFRTSMWLPFPERLLPFRATRTSTAPDTWGSRWGDRAPPPDLSRQFGLGRVGDTLALRLAYTWSHFVFVDDAQFNNNQLPGAPEHFLRSELRYTTLWVSGARLM